MTSVVNSNMVNVPQVQIFGSSSQPDAINIHLCIVSNGEDKVKLYCMLSNSRRDSKWLTPSNIS